MLTNRNPSVNTSTAGSSGAGPVTGVLLGGIWLVFVHTEFGQRIAAAVLPWLPRWFSSLILWICPLVGALAVLRTGMSYVFRLVFWCLFLIMLLLMFISRERHPAATAITVWILYAEMYLIIPEVNDHLRKMSSKTSGPGLHR